MENISPPSMPFVVAIVVLLFFVGVLLIGPVGAAAQTLLGWYVMKRLPQLRMKWSVISCWPNAVVGAALVVLALVLDVAFVAGLGVLVQRAMP